jgi:hypothetical protein
VWDVHEKRILAHQNGRRTNASCKKLCDELFAHYDNAASDECWRGNEARERNAVEIFSKTLSIRRST